EGSSGRRRGCAQGPAYVGVGAVRVDLDDGPAGRLEVRPVAGLVLEAALPDELDLRIDPVGPADEVGQCRTLEREAMAARQEAHEIRRRVDRRPIDQLHDRML